MQGEEKERDLRLVGRRRSVPHLADRATTRPRPDPELRTGRLVDPTHTDRVRTDAIPVGRRRQAGHTDALEPEASARADRIMADLDLDAGPPTSACCVRRHVNLELVHTLTVVVDDEQHLLVTKRPRGTRLPVRVAHAVRMPQAHGTRTDRAHDRGERRSRPVVPEGGEGSRPEEVVRDPPRDVPARGARSRRQRDPVVRIRSEENAGSVLDLDPDVRVVEAETASREARRGRTVVQGPGHELGGERADPDAAGLGGQGRHFLRNRSAGEREADERGEERE